MKKQKADPNMVLHAIQCAHFPEPNAPLEAWDCNLQRAFKRGVRRDYIKEGAK
jgi:hypothetical protein